MPEITVIPELVFDRRIAGRVVDSGTWATVSIRSPLYAGSVFSQDCTGACARSCQAFGGVVVRVVAAVRAQEGVDPFALAIRVGCDDRRSNGISWETKVEEVLIGRRQDDCRYETLVFPSVISQVHKNCSVYRMLRNST